MTRFPRRRRRRILRVVGWCALLAAAPGPVACTSMRVEPLNEHEGVVIANAWSLNFLSITLPRSPRMRAIDILGNASLPDVRNAQVTEWPELIWPFDWLNGLLGFYAAEVRADYGLPPPEDRFPAPAGPGTEAGATGDPTSDASDGGQP